MPSPIVNIYTEYEFNRLEFYAATRLNDLNKMLIQTLLARDATDKAALTVDPTNVSLFIQREAELQGAIRAYQHLLFLAENTPVPEASEQNEAAEVSSSPKSQDQPRTQGV